MYTKLFMLVFSLLVMQCECGNLQSLIDEPIDSLHPTTTQTTSSSNSTPPKPETSKSSSEPEPPKPSPDSGPLSTITDEMVKYAQDKGKDLLATRLKDLQKEGLDVRKVPYINDADASGRTALHEALDPDFKRLDILNILLERGANPNQLDNASDTPLGVLCSKPEENLGTIAVLLEAGAKPLLGDTYQKFPLYIAMQNSKTDNTKPIELLLTQIRDINEPIQSGNTLLHYAVDLDKPAIVKLLLEKRGAKSDIPNNSTFDRTAKDIAKYKSAETRKLFGL